MKKYLLVIFLFLTTYTTCFTQEKEMNPDRPDQTEEVHVVPAGRFQWENGFIINRFDSGRNALIVRSILRYGLSEKVEVGILTEQGRDRNRYLDETVQSAYPIAVRLKTILIQQHNWIPDITFVGYLQLPFAHNDEHDRSQKSVSMLLAFLNELGKKWKLDYTAGFQQEAFSHKFGWQVYTSLHYEITDKLECFGGTYSQFQKNEKPFHNLNGGFAYDVLKNLQVDLAVGNSIGHDERNGFLTIGFAWLL